MTSSSDPVPASLSIPITKKLTRGNFQMWRVQVLPAIHAAQLEAFIDGSDKAPEKTLDIEKDTKKLVIPNPDYAVLCMCDQHVLTYLVTSLSQEVLAGIASNSTATDMWVVISKSFALQSKSRALHFRNQLVVTCKGDLSVAVYFSTMCGYTDEMATVGKPLDDNDVVSYILNGLDVDYNSLVEHVNGMTELISPET
jgi:hypothetical protein